MKLSALFVAFAAAQPNAYDRPVVHDAHPADDTHGDYTHVDKYTASNHDSGATVTGTGSQIASPNPNTGFAAPNTGTCPVSCAYTGDTEQMSIKVQHETQHDKLKSIWSPGVGVPDANGQHGSGGVEPNSVTNKIFHRCYHRQAGTSTEALAFTKPEGVAGKVTTVRQCVCECANWSYGSCPAASCPTTCGYQGATVANTNSRSAECKFHSRVLNDDQCVAADRDVSCPDTVCPAASTQDGDILLEAKTTADWDNGDNGQCESTDDRLREKGKNSNCKWNSNRVAIQSTDYNSLDIEFRARGKKLDWNDWAKTFVRTCEQATGGSCSNWGKAQQERDIGSWNGENGGWGKLFTVSSYDHNALMRSGDNYIQFKVELATNSGNEKLQLDELKITGNC